MQAGLSCTGMSWYLEELHRERTHTHTHTRPHSHSPLDGERKPQHERVMDVFFFAPWKMKDLTRVLFSL